MRLVSERPAHIIRTGGHLPFDLKRVVIPKVRRPRSRSLILRMSLS